MLHLSSSHDQVYILVTLKGYSQLFTIVNLMLYSFFAGSNPKSAFTLHWIKNTEFIQKED
jgi:hypothetical protein